jgi:FkbM family methyltransferase
MTQFHFQRRVTGVISRLRSHMAPAQPGAAPAEIPPEIQASAPIAPVPGTPPTVQSRMKVAAIRLIRPPFDATRRFLTNLVRVQLEGVERLAIWLHEKLDAAHYKLDALQQRLNATASQDAVANLERRFHAIERQMEALGANVAAHPTVFAGLLAEQAAQLTDLTLQSIQEQRRASDDAIYALEDGAAAQRIMMESAAAMLRSELVSFNHHQREARETLAEAVAQLDARVSDAAERLRQESLTIAVAAEARSAAQQAQLAAHLQTVEATLTQRIEGLVKYFRALESEVVEALDRQDVARRQEGDRLERQHHTQLELSKELAESSAFSAKLQRERLDQKMEAFNALLGDFATTLNQVRAEQRERMTALNDTVTRQLGAQPSPTPSSPAAVDLTEVHASLRDLQGQVTATLQRATVTAARVLLPIDDETVLVRMVDCYLLAPRSDVKLLALLAESGGVGGVEPGTTALLRRLLAPGMTAVDLGAHIGMLTMVMARAVGDKGKVVACEPSPVTFPLLQRSIALNGLHATVIPHQVAAGAKNGVAEFNLSEVSGHSTLLFADADYPHATRTVEVKVRPLDKLIETKAPVHVIKMDVEGYEIEALRGMKRVLLDNPQVAIVAEYGSAVRPANKLEVGTWFRAFREQGFDIHVIDERPGAPLVLCDESYLANVDSSSNLLMTRAGGVMRGRAGL